MSDPIASIAALDDQDDALIPRHATGEWQALDAAHHFHPFTDTADLNRRGTRIFERAAGVYIYTTDGQKILDGMSGLWCVNVGYGREELVAAAAAQMRRLPFYNSFFQCTHPPAIELSRRLAEIAPPHVNHVFFAGSGSEANDTVVRAVRHYWASLGQPQRQVIVARRNAYHGSTMAGASLGGMAPMHAQGGLPIPGIVHIEQPYWFGVGRHHYPDPEAFGRAAAEWLREKILELGPETVAAFIGEPVQGAGGVIIPPATYWPRIQQICDEFGILLVVDEVICGFGRLGRWFGSEHYGLKPDLMPIAKGMTSGYLPMGGVLVSDRVAEVLIERGGEFHHGFTYSAHPASCAVALANLRLLEEEKLIARVGEIAPYYRERWLALGAHPLVGEARTLGLVGALELVADKKTLTPFEKIGAAGTRCRDAAIKNGLVMRAVRDTMITAPPFIVSYNQIDELADKAWQSLEDTARALT